MKTALQREKIFRTLFLFLIFISIVFKISAQDFGSIGTKWYYTLPHFSDPGIDYVEIQSIGDTNIYGHFCHHLQIAHGYDCSTIGSNAFLYEENGSVYYFVSQMNKFSLLYDFNLEIDDYYKIYVNGFSQTEPDSISYQVTGVFTETINGVSLKKLSIKLLSGGYSFSTSGNDTIVERIGASYLFPQYALCEAGPNQLRCFEDSVLGFYSTNVAPACDFISTGISETSNISAITFFPNPANQFAICTIPFADNKIYSIKVFDVFGTLPAGRQGELNVPVQFTQQEFQLDVSSLAQGIYFVQVSDEKNSFSQKLLIQHY